VLAVATKAASSPASILILGECGTGKTVLARAIHDQSPQRGNPFLTLHCPSLSRDLVESELFGHAKGAFTGATSDTWGKVAAAEGGTLFLDEIGELSLSTQPKLLRLIEAKEYERVGESKVRRANVRIIAATNRNLEQAVKEGRFREDLFYRLSVIHIHVPPLRERREEIPHLASFFLREAGDRLSKLDVRLSQSTLELFDDYPWPGNVRQLRNEIQRAVALAPSGGAIEPEHLSRQLAAAMTSGTTGSPRGRRATLADAVGKLERETIRAALEQASGNVSQTARLLGLTRRGLYLKMSRLGLGPRS
jgi:NtrC-family two-component system response regulator AlgB